MNRIATLIALAIGVSGPVLRAQSTQPAAQPGKAPAADASAAPVSCPAATTLDDLTKALDDAVSGPADKDRTCLRQLLYPNARLVPVTKSREGSFGPRVLTVDEWIDAVHKRGTGVFYERQVKVKSETFGHVAQLWSTYEIRPTPDGKATQRGINSIQAVFDGQRWRVLEIQWQVETPTDAIPEKYLP